MTSFKIFLFVFCAVFGKLATAEEAAWPTQGWERSNPSAQGMKEDEINALVQDILNLRNVEIHSLLIVKDGYLVLEEYFHGRNGDAPHMNQSVTKSVTSLLTGVAIEQGFLGSVDQTVISLFPEYDNLKHMSARKSALKVEDLLTMTSGFRWQERRDNGHLNTVFDDWDRFILDKRMQYQPGEHNYYNSGNPVLLAGIIENGSGLRVDAFARQYLFGPLGIEDAGVWPDYKEMDYSKDLDWAVAPHGMVHTGGGLHLRSRDLAKLGYLVLRDGVWDGRRILPEGWIEASMTRHVNRARNLPGLPKFDYGYLWWLLPLEQDKPMTGVKGDIYMAWGYRGQFIFIIPEFDAVVVFTAGSEWPGEVKPIELLYERILPAIIN